MTDPYAAIESAYRRLREQNDLPRTPGGETLLRECARRLADLGLGEPAGEILAILHAAQQSGTPSEAIAPESTRSGRVPDEETAALIALNIGCLERRGDIDLQWLLLLRRLAPHITVHRCRNDFLHASVVNRDGVRAWLPSFRSGTLAPSLARQLEALSPHRVLLIGVSEPITGTIARITSGPSDQPARALFLADPEPLHWLGWLASADHRDLLDDPRCQLLTGPEPAEAYRQLLSSRPDLPTHSAVIDTLQRPPLKAALQQAAEAAQQQRGEARKTLAQQIAAREAARSDADCAARLTPGATIIGVVSRFTTMVCHSMRDIAAACEAQGYRFRIIEEVSGHEPHSGETIMRTLLEEDPALVILINHLRHEYAEMFASVPMVCWVQDPVDNILSPGVSDACGSRDFLVGFYQEMCTQTLGYRADRFLSLPHYPVSDRIFHDRPRAENDPDDAPPCDMVYVGHLHQTPEEIIAAALARESAPGQRLIRGIDDAVQRVLSAKRSLTHAGARMLVETVADSLGGRLKPAALTGLAHGFAFRLFDLRLRLESLSWAAEWATRNRRTLRIHGKGWDRIDFLQPFAHQPVEHGAPLRRCYASAALALQTIPSGINHQRSFEALLSGCLPLVRYTPLDFAGLTIEEFQSQHGEGRDCPLSPYCIGLHGLQRIVFRSSEEFQACAERYLENRQQADHIRSDFASAIRERLTYDRMTERILTFVREGLGGA